MPDQYSASFTCGQFVQDIIMSKGGSHYDKLTALKTGEGALCPKYCPILMKIGEQVDFYVYYSYNWGPRNFDKNYWPLMTSNDL